MFNLSLIHILLIIREIVNKPVFSKKRNNRTRKCLSKTRIKSYILEVSNEQQRGINKAIGEYNKRMEHQL